MLAKLFVVVEIFNENGVAILLSHNYRSGIGSRHGYFKFHANGHIVLLREIDASLNATQSAQVAGKDKTERKLLFRCFKAFISTERHPDVQGQRITGWIAYKSAQAYCAELSLEGLLRPLLDFGLKLFPEKDKAKRVVAQSLSKLSLGLHVS